MTPYEKDLLALREDILPRLEASLLRHRDPLPNGCIGWNARHNKDGYGTIGLCINKKSVIFRAHRVAWLLKFKRPLPEGKMPDHTCRNRGCNNEDHLEPVTSQVNTLRGEGPVPENAAKTECVRGHPLSGANLYINDGRRYCKTCRVARTKQWRKDKAS